MGKQKQWQTHFIFIFKKHIVLLFSFIHMKQQQLQYITHIKYLAN